VEREELSCLQTSLTTYGKENDILVKKMVTANPQIHRLRIASQNTRKNLPAKSSRRRGETNFLRSFERAYLSRVKSGSVIAGEFSLHGYGIADLIWIGWEHAISGGDFTAVSLERKLSRRQLFAFEAKLKDWNRALKQAFRYRYFADKAIVIMPRNNAATAISNLPVFQDLRVGLWTFDVQTGSIVEHFTPMRVQALNPAAKKRAIALISSNFKLSELRKNPDTIP
jgi:hypothetical protein